MQVAINYSPAAASLVQQGRIQLDAFKVPAWPDVAREARDILPTYIHFPLKIGRDMDNVIDSERKEPADLDAIAALLEESDTPYVNVHFGVYPENYPEIARDSTATEHLRLVVQNAIRGVRALQERFGKENVIIENVPNLGGETLNAVTVPEAITHIVDVTGCGFLFDLSHARIAAEQLDINSYDYITRLPVHQMREMHVTGLHTVTSEMLAWLERLGFEDTLYDDLIGLPVDHLPFTEVDWPFIEWSMAQIASGIWGTPWVVTYEYGGIGGFWEAISDPEAMADGVPRLYKTVHGVLTA